MCASVAAQKGTDDIVQCVQSVLLKQDSQSLVAAKKNSSDAVAMCDSERL